VADDVPLVTRREQYAKQTQQAIVDSARRLFAEQGYFATKVDDIAADAGVAPATVYSVTGGKSGLLAEMIRLWSTDPVIEATLSHVATSNDPRQIILDLASASRAMRQQFADVIRILVTTAPHDPGVAAQLKPATELYRTSIDMIAARLASLGALREGTEVVYAADVLWFYFGYSSYSTLHNENGWPYHRAEHWLAEQAIRDVLGPLPRATKRA
jgi:AcrR family transcriptional regulator